MKLLIVDDEALIRDVIKEYAFLEGYSVMESVDGLDAIEKVEKYDFDIIIMDIMMPKLDGYQAIKEIKKIKNIPVIILSARQEEYDKLLGFEIGIDDYITKPFSPKELIARIKAISKRSELKKKYTYGDLVLDDVAHEVYLKNKKIILTPKEYDLLKYLVSNCNVALSRDSILFNVWGYEYYGDERTVDTHIKTLRNHLKPIKENIVTVRGMGYKFEYNEEIKD